jgi:hypothetical protein
LSEVGKDNGAMRSKSGLCTSAIGNAAAEAAELLDDVKLLGDARKVGARARPTAHPDQH